ncbi:MAG: hypothetical protein PVSMB7_27640 [Chloroflexota bacterium]
MVIWRRTLYCKLGQAGRVLELSREAAAIVMATDDSAVAHRLYTDLSGTTERVITEIERETFVHPREASKRMHGNQDFLRIIKEIGPLVNSADVEFLSLDHTRTRDTE